MLRDQYAREGASMLSTIYPDRAADHALFERLRRRGIRLMGHPSTSRQNVGRFLIGLAVAGLERADHAGKAVRP